MEHSLKHCDQRRHCCVSLKPKLNATTSAVDLFSGLQIDAINGTSERARSKGEGSNLGGSTGIRPFAEECLELSLFRVHPSAVRQGSMLRSCSGLWKAT